MENRKINEWWNAYTPAFKKTNREFMIQNGGAGFDVDEFTSGEFGEAMMNSVYSSLTFTDDLDPALNEYWKNRGIIRKVYGDPGDLSAYTVYCPEKVLAEGKPVSLIVNVYARWTTMCSVENLGYVNLAAKTQEFIVVIPKDGNGDEHLLSAVEKVTAEYPVDPERVYLSGHSFGGVTTGRQSAAHTDVYAAGCVLGSEYGGLNTSAEELVMAKKNRIPIIIIDGTEEGNKVLPLTEGVADSAVQIPQMEPNITPIRHTREDGLRTINFWRDVNGCRKYTADEDVFNLPTQCEREVGGRAEHTETRVILGREHYICDQYSEDGHLIFRRVGVDNCPHVISPTSTYLAWEFFRRFRRNRETGEVIFVEQ